MIWLFCSLRYFTNRFIFEFCYYSRLCAFSRALLRILLKPLEEVVGVIPNNFSGSKTVFYGGTWKMHFSLSFCPKVSLPFDTTKMGWRSFQVLKISARRRYLLPKCELGGNMCLRENAT